MLVPAVTREIDLDSLFLLNATGVIVWEHLDGQRTAQDLGVLVAQSAGIAPETAAADVALFLSSLLERNLAERV
jgi:sensor domain CHASE-containing protein